MLVVMSALQIELGGLEKDIRDVRISRFASGKIIHGNYQGEPIAWVISGIGKKNAQQAVKQISQDLQVSLLLALGFAGSLTPGLGIGDLVICRTIRSEDPEKQIIQTDAWLVEIASLVGKQLPVRTWTLDNLTVDKLLHLPDQKSRLYTRWKTGLVEMENYWFAEQADQHGLKFLAVRAISDTAQDVLPDLNGLLDSTGEIPVLRGMQHFVKNPREIRLLPALYRNSRLAQKNLVEFFKNFYQTFLEERGRLEYAH